MKTTRFRPLPSACLAACLALAPALPEARAVSPAAGYLTFTLPATTATATTYLSAPLLPAAIYTGTATAVTENTLTVSNGDWTTGALAGTTPYYVALKTGAQAGRTLRIRANTGSVLTLDLTDDSAQSTSLTASGFAFTTSDTFEICPGYTLGSFFGATAAAQVLTGGADAETADNVSLWNWAANRFDAFYFNTTAGAWRKSDGTTDAAATILAPGTTLAITRRAGRSVVQLTQLGRVPTVAPLQKHPGAGATRYTGLRLPVDFTLAQLSLGSNWTKSNSAFTADTLSIFNAAAGKWEAYYQRTDGGWRKSTSATLSQDATVIPAGTAIAWTKRMAVSGSASFLTISLPYVP